MIRFEESENNKSYEARESLFSVHADASSSFSDTFICNFHDNVKP